jgi:hypothetical protein
MCALVVGGGRREIGIRDVGHSCTVPDDPYIKLCYYLNCVHQTSVSESIPESLLSWESKYPGTKRSTEALRAVISWAEQYSPVKMKQSGYFIMVPYGTLNGSSNKFIRVTATSTQVRLLATSEAALGLLRQSSGSVDIMLYEERWEDFYYYNARRSVNELIEKQESICNVC